MSRKYLVFREYSKKERPSIEERSRFYGWSSSKDVIKAFLKQRDNRKYHVVKTNDEEIGQIYSEVILDGASMIDYTRLRFASTHEPMILFTTADELRETEIKIQNIFIALSSLSNIEGDTKKYLEMFMNLDEYYGDALYYIGYRPEEVDAVFDSVSEYDNYSGFGKLEGMINDAYEGLCNCTPDYVSKFMTNPPGLMNMTDVSNKIIYSVESFIKVMKEDL